MALCLALVMALCVFAGCSKSQSGDPYSFADVTVVSLVDPDQEEATAEDASSDYKEELFAGEVVVYSETGTITLKDVILAYCDAQNVDYSYDESKNQFTKIAGLSANGGKFWNFSVNGSDSKLAAEVKPEDKIVLSYTK